MAASRASRAKMSAWTCNNFFLRNRAVPKRSTYILRFYFSKYFQLSGARSYFDATDIERSTERCKLNAVGTMLDIQKQTLDEALHSRGECAVGARKSVVSRGSVPFLHLRIPDLFFGSGTCSRERCNGVRLVAQKAGADCPPRCLSVHVSA